MTAYYNDNDKAVAEWLRELIRAGEIPDGDVDERSILDVQADDLKGYTQCHFFAGIAGWPLALRLAGWPDSRPVWTGSPPCQPFSSAGEGKGRDDARHLAPKFIGLVREGRPEVLFGEQVASAAVFGKVAKPSRKRIAATPEWAWLDDLSDRLEAAHYAVGATDIPSASVGAPHIRQRTFFGAYDLGLAADRIQHAESDRRLERWSGSDGWSFASGYCVDGLADGSSSRPLPASQPGIHCREEIAGARDGEPERLRDAGGMGHSGRARGETWLPESAKREERLAEVFNDGSDRLSRSDAGRPCTGRVADTTSGHTGAEWQQPGREYRLQSKMRGGTFGLANDDRGRPVLRRGDDAKALGGSTETRTDVGSTLSRRDGSTDGPCPTNGFWGDADWLFCRDGKWRPVKSGTFPLAHGVPGRVGLLRGYGNAINPWAAKEFIEAFEEARSECFRLDRASVLATDNSGAFG